MRSTIGYLAGEVGSQVPGVGQGPFSNHMLIDQCTKNPMVFANVLLNCSSAIFFLAGFPICYGCLVFWFGFEFACLVFCRDTRLYGTASNSVTRENNRQMEISW